SVQAAVPDCMVAAALHHVPAKELGDLDEPIESDVLICSDHRSAVGVTSDIVAKIPNMRPLDAGELAMATPIESFTAVLLQLHQRYTGRVAGRLAGTPDDGARGGPGGGARQTPAGGGAAQGNGTAGNDQAAEGGGPAEGEPAG